MQQNCCMSGDGKAYQGRYQGFAPGNFLVCCGQKVGGGTEGNFAGGIQITGQSSYTPSTASSCINERVLPCV